ncbi:MAG: hypothetical protein K6G84_00980 [Lachnospiraceae bacterium]|nr:hypothetical protein [Lachnospiraceae bacterium]
MDNQRYYYLAEGECEEKLLKALKEKPSLIHPGKVSKFNVIEKVLKPSKLMGFEAGSYVIFVFDTDTSQTTILKKNIELVKSLSFKVEVLTIAQVLNFEDEITYCTDVKKAQELTKSESVNGFKNAVNKMKDAEFRNALKRHKFDITKLWTKKPPKIYGFIKQQSDKVKF